MEIFKSIVTNVLTALYQPFWFAVLLTIFILFFYMYAYHPTDTGKGIKAACLAWVRTFKNSLYFRKLFCLVFFTVMILFRTLLNRNMWMNPLSNVMGGWWIWSTQADGTVILTTECFENIALTLPIIQQSRSQQRTFSRTFSASGLFHSSSQVCDVASSAYLPLSGKSRLGCEAGAVMKFVFIPFVYCWRAGT